MMRATTTAILTGLCALAGLPTSPARATPSSPAAPGSEDKPAPAPAPPAAPAQEKNAAPAGDAIETIKKFIADQKIDTKKDGWKTKLPKPPQLTFDPKKKYYWVMETNKGSMKFELMPDVAPMHVSSCIYLNTLGFYDGLKFHRAMKEFMAQGGCPLGNGQGNPGYQMRIEIKDGVKHDKAGVLSTARTSDPNTDRSQFFLTFGPTPMLDKQYTIYGAIVEGGETLKALEACGQPRDYDERRLGTAKPTEDLFIKKATIEVK